MLKRHKVLAGAIAGVDLALAAAIITTGQAYLIPIVAKLGMMEQIKLFTMIAGGGLVGGETLAYYLKLRTQKAKEKLANGHLISSDDILDILGGDGMILSKDVRLKEKFDFEGSVIFGATGAGKSTSFFIPNLLNKNLKGSLVITDIKGELFELTSGFQRDVCGRRVLKFSPLEPEMSEKYNLLTSCKSSIEVQQLAQSLIFNGSLSTELLTGKTAGGVEWSQMATPYFSSALLYCKELEPPFNTIEYAFQLLITLDFKQLDLLFSNSKNQDCITQWNIIKSGERADRTVDSIRITFATNMQIFTDERINQTGSKTTFDFESFRKEPTILYITYPVDEAKYISPFTAPLFNKMLNTFVKGFIKNDPNCLPVTILADEFANIGMISSMNTLCSVIRASEISMNICLQGLTQLYQLYGRDNGKNILNNLKTKMILPSISDEEALNYISSLCGEKEIETISKNENKNSTSTSYGKTKVKMFSPDDIRCLDNDKILIITSNKYPILTTQNTYFLDEEYKNNIKNPVQIKKQPIEIFDYKDYIEELKLDLTKKNEVVSDVKQEISKLFRGR